MRKTDNLPKKSKPLNTGWVVPSVLLLLVVGGYFGLKPLRVSLAGKYLARGEAKLADRQYVPAIVEFRKSDWLLKDSATQALVDANAMQTDILAGEMYFRKYNKVSTLESLARAKEIPSSQNDGLKRIKTLIETGKDQEAEVSAELLLEMDQTSSKAWAYSGIARLQSAMTVSMTEANRQTKLKSAQGAFEKAIEIDPDDAISKKYLDQIIGLLK